MKKQFTPLICLLFCLSCQKTPAPPTQTVNVHATQAIAERIPITIEAIGHFTAFNSADIKAQVEGVLMEIHFTEGDEVEEGDLLFTIDPRPYEAQRDQSIAQRAQNVAKLQYAKDKVNRYQALVPDNYVSQLDYKQYLTDMMNFEAAVMANDADIRLAEVNLDYCYIRAPFSGITSKKLIDKGNLIGNDQSTPMITLKQIDPMYIDFSIPERDFHKLMQQRALNEVDVVITYPTFKNANTVARLVLVDNEIAEGTGMIPLRAQITNPLRTFWPGQFLKLQLVLDYIDQAVIVPQSAVNIGQKGRYIYVIGKDGTAEYRSIEVGEYLGRNIQITKGIAAGETIITDGQINVLPGVKVTIKEKTS